MWSDDFYRFDYIGAPWWGGKPSVGNGGFSLRSKKLLRALEDLNFIEGIPEDVLICTHYRSILERKYQIKFAPVEVAERFSFEMAKTKKEISRAFGFHGMHNFSYVLTEREMTDWLSWADDSIFKTRHPRKLIRNLIRQGRTETALHIINKRIRLLGFSADHLTFWLWAHVIRLIRCGPKFRL
jgi:hypothetical protein